MLGLVIVLKMKERRERMTSDEAYGLLNEILWNLKKGCITQSTAKKKICKLFRPKAGEA